MKFMNFISQCWKVVEFNKPPSLLSLPLPPSPLSFLTNKFQTVLIQSVWTDPEWFIYHTGSSDLFSILGCMTSNFLYLSFSTLYSSSLWRTNTFDFSKLNKLLLSNKPPISIKAPLPPNMLSSLIASESRLSEHGHLNQQPVHRRFSFSFPFSSLFFLRIRQSVEREIFRGFNSISTISIEEIEGL